MPAKTKVYDEAAETAGVLRDEIVKDADADGVRTERERELIGIADRLVAFTETTATRVRVGIRWFGGGRVDNGLLCQLRDCERLLSKGYTQDNDGEPTPIMRFTVRTAHGHKKSDTALFGNVTRRTDEGRRGSSPKSSRQ